MNYTYNKGTSCPKIGIKIHESNNSENVLHRPTGSFIEQNYITNRSNVTKPVDFYNTTLDQLDLDLNHYSLDDLFKLFNINSHVLDEDVLKNSKQIVLKMHPDKSKLDPKYFLFFSNAYKRLYSIYEFQNKSSKKRQNNEEYYDEGNQVILNQLLDNKKELKDPTNFNGWFNTQFEKHRIEDPNESGYGNWLKSNEGIYNGFDNISKSNMNSAFETQKKQLQSMIVYNGISDYVSSSFSGTLLNENGNNFGGQSGGLNYTDLKQAYIESVIPVTEEDYERMPKYKNVNDYKSQRDRIDTTPLSKVESERILMETKNNMDKESTALAYKYAVQAEKAKEKSNSFWGEIKQLTGW
jgi:curved DNA-binding protein CbpA